jgi:hypothetical protein
MARPTSVRTGRRTPRQGGNDEADIGDTHQRRTQVAVGIARAADPRLDEADLALQKAVALLEASQTGGVDPKTQRLFDKAVARAIGTSRTRGRASPTRRTLSTIRNDL